MVCSTCGYENQTGNRYCGMCGTPLPHRPLTTPGAQSTASLTRPLAEKAGSGEASTSLRPLSRSGLEVVPRQVSEQRSPQDSLPNRAGLAIEPPRPAKVTDQDTSLDTPGPEAAGAPPELVPEISLHDYIQNFHYTPPSDSEERTMRGDTPGLRSEPSGLHSEPSVPSNGTSGHPIEAAATRAEVPPPASDDDVRERLGLEADNTAEERIDRPRFLDFNPPSTPTAPASKAQSIAGPSFLGLNDASPVEAAAEEGESDIDETEFDGPRRGIWRILLAAAVVVVFGLLGLLEWQAQVHQTNNGPVEVVKMKMRSLGKTANNASTESSSSDSASKPDMQVESPKPRKQSATANDATSTPVPEAAAVPNTTVAGTPPASTAPVPSENQPAAAQPAGPAPQKPAMASGTATDKNPVVAAKTAPPTSAVDKSKLAEPQHLDAAAPAAAKPKPSRQSADDDQEVVVRKIVPGADEMAKADNASDSAAEAAWLWKATAKGNPTAPVRLADMYAKGEGVPRSCEQALVLLKTAAEKENSMARNQLASMYGSGVCVPRNRVEAYRWVSSALAANPNSEWAQQRRDLLWQQMTPEERTLAAKYR